MVFESMTKEETYYKHQQQLFLNQNNQISLEMHKFY